MMRHLALALAAAGVAGVVAAAPARDWSQVVTPAPQGSYVVGNPKARVKLVEYLSYTCPHCRHFGEESAAVLRGKMVRSGSTSIEFRNAVHDKLDLAAAVLARCTGPRRFLRYHDGVFAAQPEWTARGVEWDAANLARTSALTPDKQLRALADGAGLSTIAKTAGMTDVEIGTCFATPANVQRTLAVAQESTQRISGTPSFELGGRVIERTGWDGLEPQLRAAGAK